MNSGEDFRLPGDFAARHARLLAEYLADSDLIADSTMIGEALRESAKLGLLPIMTSDWGGCYSLRADGTVVSFPWDNIHDIQIETDPRIRNMALFQGSKKFPELAAFVPARPIDAVVCPYCEGTGNGTKCAPPGFPMPILCYCGELGWLPPGTPPTA